MILGGKKKWNGYFIYPLQDFRCFIILSTCFMLCIMKITVISIQPLETGSLFNFFKTACCSSGCHQATSACYIMYEFMSWMSSKFLTQKAHNVTDWDFEVHLNCKTWKIVSKAVQKLPLPLFKKKSKQCCKTIQNSQFQKKYFCH